MREPATHVWPALPVNTDAEVTPSAAASRSASANTMLADLPPSSKCSGLSVDAARSEMTRAVAVDPVKLMRPDTRIAHERVAGLLAQSGHDVHDSRGNARFVEQLTES